MDWKYFMYTENEMKGKQGEKVSIDLETELHKIKGCARYVHSTSSENEQEKKQW